MMTVFRLNQRRPANCSRFAASSGKRSATEMLKFNRRHNETVTASERSARRSTLCLKKGPTCKLSITSSNRNRFSKFLHYWKAYKIRYKTNVTTHLTLGMLLHYLGKLKDQVFCRCGRKCKQSTFLVASNFVILPQIVIFWVLK